VLAEGNISAILVGGDMPQKVSLRPQLVVKGIVPNTPALVLIQDAERSVRYLSQEGNRA
jgi:hypothetical protein